MKWPGGNFHLANGTEWMCNICRQVANTGRGAKLRRSVRDAHTVQVCAARMRSALPTEIEHASNMAKSIGSTYYDVFTHEINKTQATGTGTGTGNSLMPPVNPDVASRSQAPSSPSRKRKRKDEEIDDYKNKRVAKFFDRSIHFGTSRTILCTT